MCVASKATRMKPCVHYHVFLLFCVYVVFTWVHICAGMCIYIHVNCKMSNLGFSPWELSTLAFETCLFLFFPTGICQVG